MSEVGHELVVATGDLPTIRDFAQAEQALEVVRQRGDVEMLHSASVEASAAALYYQRNEHKEAADGFARLKVLAEAGIGSIDIERWPIRGKEPLEIVGKAITKKLRSQWRLLALADERGMLRPTLGALAIHPTRECCTHWAWFETRKAGAAWTVAAPLRAAYERAEISQAELADRAGVSRPAVSHLLSGRGGQRRDGVNYYVARRIAPLLGIDPAELPPVPDNAKAIAMRRSGMRRRAASIALREKERTRAAKRAGGKIDEAWTRLRLTAEVLDPAEHECTTPEAKAAMRSAYEYVRKAEDELARALGVA